MNRLLFLLFILVINTTFLFAQTDRLQVSVQPLEGSETDREMTIDWQSDRQLASGILIQLPEGSRAVPMSVRVNDTEMWLKKGDSLPGQDSVVVWQMNPDGLVLLFDAGLIGSGDRLTVRCQAVFPEQTAESSTLRIREVSMQDGQVVSGDADIASGSIQISQEN